MARKRLVAPEFFTHRGLAMLEKKSSLPVRVAFAGLWTRCDRRGVFRWDADALQLAILPYDDCEMADVLAALEGAGFVQQYIGPDGRQYGAIPSFSRWQTFHVHEKPSKDPGPPVQHRASTVSAPCQHGVSTPVTVTGTGTVTNQATQGEPLESVAGFPDTAERLSPPALAVLTRYCRSAALPLAVVASVRALNERDGYDWPVIDRALIEYGTVSPGDKLSAEGLRRFCLKLTTTRPADSARADSAREAFLRAE